MNKILTNKVDLSNYRTVNQTEKRPTTGSKYEFVSTMRIVEALENYGWVPTMVKEQPVRSASHRGYQRHMLSFYNPELPSMKDGNVVQIVLVNGHDGWTPLTFHTGVFRLVCSNGLIVSTGDLEKFRLKHVGNGLEERVLGIINDVTKRIPELSRMIERFDMCKLTKNEQIAYASAAQDIKWYALPKVMPKELILPRRDEDKGNTLWKTFNIVQEKLINGGLSRSVQTGRQITMKPVKGILSEVEINRSLWDLTTRTLERKVNH